MSPRLALVPIVVLALAPQPSQAGLFGKKAPPEDFSAARAAPPVVVEPATGSIFAASQGYAALYEGWRARRVGDPLTIVLVEQTAASKSASSKLDSQGSASITPPTTGPLNLFPPSSATASGGRAFNGKGAADQANSLSGEVSVTVAEVYPNGTMLVQGQKRLTLNRGDERVQISGLVRAIDISPDNRILSTRVANANIRYVGKGEIARASKQGWLQRFFMSFMPL